MVEAQIKRLTHDVAMVTGSSSVNDLLSVINLLVTSSSKTSK